MALPKNPDQIYREFRDLMDNRMDELTWRELHTQQMQMSDMLRMPKKERNPMWDGERSEGRFRLYHESQLGKTTRPSPMYEIVRRMKYKPNFRMWVEGSYLVLVMDVPDNRKPEEIIDVHSRQQIPDKYFVDWHEGRVDEFVNWVRDMVRGLEEHELNEWLAFDGKLLYDPHKGEFRTP